MPFNGDGSYNAIADNEEDFYLQIQRGVLFKMKLNNNGQVLSYNRMDPLGADTNNYEFINYLTMDPNDDDILYFPNGRKLWRNNSSSDFERSRRGRSGGALAISVLHTRCGSETFASGRTHAVLVKRFVGSSVNGRSASILEISLR